jgi:hypothetical protein
MLLLIFHCSNNLVGFKLFISGAILFKCTEIQSVQLTSLFPLLLLACMKLHFHKIVPFPQEETRYWLLYVPLFMDKAGVMILLYMCHQEVPSLNFG